MKNLQMDWPAGIKRTKPREYVLITLENAKSPLSVIDIYTKIKENDSSIWLSTIYRTLELFVSKGLVIKTSVMDSDMAIYELNRNVHKHYAICVNCHKIIALDNCPMDQFTPDLEDKNFRVVGHKVELYGYCKNCDTHKSGI